MTDTPLLQADNLQRHYGGVTALGAFSLRLDPGELVGLIGPNGAGKTTAFNVISGVVAASGGRLRFVGEDLGRASPQHRARLGLTRTFQNIRLFPELTVLDNVKAGAHLRHGAGLARTLLGGGRLRESERKLQTVAGAALERVGLQRLAGRPAQELAYGDQRRVEIARSLASEPRLILLDEPAAGMNEHETGQLAELIRSLHAEGLAIVLVEHDVQMVARLCPRLVVMDRGEAIADGETDAVLRDPQVVSAYLGSRKMAGVGAAC